ncbi:MAG: transporter substrate-binding domain-containing protein [Desulfobacterium sp.]|nr:transporter substrate-binding domain-containing protein [Desulfobacterium sp.]
MKRTVQSILMAGILCIYFIPNLFAAETVRLTNGEWKPFTSKKLKHYGIFSHITTEAFNTVGIKVENGFFPWKRSITLVESGEWDGTIGWAKSPEREEKFYISEPLYEGSYVFFNLKDSGFDWQYEDDLQGIKVGVTRGYVDEEWFKAMKKAGKNVIYEAATSDLQNFKKLLAGRIRIFATQKDVGLVCILENFPSDTANKIIYHPKFIRTSPLHGLFTKNNNRGKKYMNLFNQGLKNLKDSGRYEQMLQDFKKGYYQKEGGK